MKKIRLISILTVLFLMASYSTKTNSQVTQEWVATYNGPSNYSDGAQSVTVDVTGNIYVTGSSVVSEFDIDYATIKYNSSGIIQWIARYNGPASGQDIAYAIAVDGSGNVYVTGSSSLEINNTDYATIKYNQYGIEQWVRRYNGPANSSDEASSIAVDVNGNVYVSGESWGVGTYSDYATIKYDIGGNQLWVARYDGPESNNSLDYVTSIAIDASENVYITGSSRGNGTSDDYATIKYDGSGNQLWVARYNGPYNGHDNACSLALDYLGNVYVTGSSESQNDLDYATIKYNSSGTLQWVTIYNGQLNLADAASSMAIDNSGNIYVTGSSEGDFVTIKYNGLGIQQWLAKYDGVAPRNNDFPVKTVIDNLGNSYVTGLSYDMAHPDWDWDVSTVKYNSLGVKIWSAIYDGSANYSDRPYSLALDLSGNIYVTGTSWQAQSSMDFMTIKYAQGDFVHFDHSGLNKLIGDMSSAADTIKVNIFDLPSQFSVTDVNVIIDTVLHPNAADLEFTLFHAGITDTLIYHAGGSGDNFILTILNDSAITSISNGSAPFTGSFRPYKPLSILDNNDATGNWILRVYDRTTGNTGTLNAWTLQLKFNSVIAIQPISNEIPMKCSLTQNYPNPFNPVTSIRYQVTGSRAVILKVYDILGKVAAVLVNEKQNPGTYEVQFDAIRMASGLYFYKLEAGDYTEAKKMILIK